MSNPSPPGPSLPPLRILLERAVHDLKNPLAVVRATLEWLDAELGPRAGEVGEAVRDASDATSRLSTLVDHLHAIARLTDPAAMTPEPLEMVELVEASVRTVAARAAARGRRFATSLEPMRVRVLDRPLLVEAITAALEAAARHAPSDTTLDVSLTAGPEGAVLAVRTAEEAGAAQPNATLPGSGLGLLFARATLEAHGGTLEVAGGARSVRIVARLPLA